MSHLVDIGNRSTNSCRGDLLMTPESFNILVVNYSRVKSIVAIIS